MKITLLCKEKLPTKMLKVAIYSPIHTVQIKCQKILLLY